MRRKVKGGKGEGGEEEDLERGSLVSVLPTQNNFRGQRTIRFEHLAEEAPDSALSTKKYPISTFHFLSFHPRLLIPFTD